MKRQGIKTNCQFHLILLLQTQVYIEVGDINDNDPVFEPVNYTVYVYENSPVRTPLVNVTATDADNGQNARITYSVTGGDPHSVFTVDTQVNRADNARSIYIRQKTEKALTRKCNVFGFNDCFRSFYMSMHRLIELVIQLVLQPDKAKQT